jgi:hypothetical protein
MKMIIIDATGEIEFMLEDASGHDLTGRTVRDVTAADLLPGELAAARKAQVALIDAARNALAYGGCDTPAGRVQTDPESMVFVTGETVSALIAEQAGENYSTRFILADNTLATLNAAGMIALGRAVKDFVSPIVLRARVLKDRIEAATTVAAIEAITWTMADPA